jgi:hypothetical protein
MLSFHLCQSLPCCLLPLPFSYKILYTISEYVILAPKNLHKACELSISS